MVDFKNLVGKKKTIEYNNLNELFESLDRQTSHIALRPAQEQAVKSLSSLRDQRDIVLKISTGAGKTAIALLFLLSHMEEKKRPVVYLCPTIQLVSQVQEEASKLGIDAVIYPAGEPHPPIDGTRAKAIIICTYDKLFNAKTTFDRSDVMLRPCAIVLDDAHAGVEEIKDAFTLRISESDLFEQILNIFDSSFSSYKPGLWQSIKERDPISSIEVPFWIWKPTLDNVREALSYHQKEDNFIFVWPYLRDSLRWCRCIISGNGLEILPDILPVHMITAYDEANYRLFMSATLADDSVLVRELNCNPDSAKNPLIPRKDKGLGERMVLAPSLINKELGRNFIMKLCNKLSNKINVVVLSPSKKLAKDWEKYGAKSVLSDNVPEAIQKLKDIKSELRFVVFVQRYDGIDLPDSSCRVLVIDGIPYGEGIADKYDSSITQIPGGIRNRLVYRIEQGMGRAVRSHADYAVIILVGSEIANFIARRDVLEMMNPDTRAQLELAIDLTKLAIDDDENPNKVFIDLIKQALNRDEGWKQYYFEKIRSAEYKIHDLNKENGIEMAKVERLAFNCIIGNNYPDAVKIMGEAITKHVNNEKDKSWYLQRLANYKYEYNLGEAFEIQKAAYEKNNLMFLPPIMTKRAKYVSPADTQTIIRNWFENFENPNGAIAAIQDIKNRLSYELNPKLFERSIKELAELVGAVGSQPELEFGEGSDDLWLWPNLSLVLEAKNENQKSLHKKDAGQLTLSLNWFNKNYPTREPAIPVVVAKINICDKKSGFPDDTRILLPNLMKNLLQNIESFYCALIDNPNIISNPSAMTKTLNEFKLTADQFVKNYTVSIKCAK